MSEDQRPEDLDDEQIQRLADEAERGYDPEQLLTPAERRRRIDEEAEKLKRNFGGTLKRLADQ